MTASTVSRATREKMEHMFAPEPSPTHPRRLTAWTLLVPVVGVLTGSLFASTSQAAKGQDLRGDSTNLVELINRENRVNQEGTGLLAQTQAAVDALRGAAATRDATLAPLERRGDALALAAGRTPVRGPALSVTLTDSTLRGDQIPQGMTVDDIIVHQQDVQAVVNALWRGGAEAMMLMDQRVISTSAVRCVGNTLILQGRVYSPPFVVTAIGNLGDLRAALDRDPQVGIYREYVHAVGLGYVVQNLGTTTFPPYAGAITLAHATVDRP